MTPTAKFWVRRRVLEPRYGNLKSWNFRPGQPLQMFFFSKSFLFIVKTTKSYSSGASFMKNYPSILELSLKFDFQNIIEFPIISELGLNPANVFDRQTSSRS